MMANAGPKVGVTRWARHLPPGRLTAEEMGRGFGWSAAKLLEETGMAEKAVGVPGQTASDHGLAAARQVMEGLDPASIGLLIYTSASLPDHPVWFAPYRLHHELGLVNARLHELRMGCLGSLHALEVAKAMLQTVPGLDRALIVAGEAWHFDQDFMEVAYRSPGNEPWLILGDGGAAILLETERSTTLTNHLGGFVHRVDAEHHGLVSLRTGGTANYVSQANLDAGLHHLHTPHQSPEELKRFGMRYLSQMRGCVRDAWSQAGWEGKPDLLVPSQLKTPLMRLLSAKLGVPMERITQTMLTCGHVGTCDLLFGIGLALDGQLLGPGTRAALISSGVSFGWAAATWEGC